MTKTTKKYSGVVVPMITPVKADFSIDENAVATIMKTFTKNNVATFLLGTTGESTSVSDKEKDRLIEYGVKYAEGKVDVFAGISSNCLQDCIDNGNKYADMGVTAVVAHLPFYYPITAEAMVPFFEKIADNVKCPLILYNNPITVKESMPLDVVEKLSYHKNIVGFKDSERGVERLDEAIRLWKDREDFSFLLGWAAQSSYAVLKGCDGIVPSTGNLTPALYNELYKAALNGEADKANALQEETNIISEIYQKGKYINDSIPALKVLLSEYDLCQPYAIPPLTSTGEAEQKVLRTAIKTTLPTI